MDAITKKQIKENSSKIAYLGCMLLVKLINVPAIMLYWAFRIFSGYKIEEFEDWISKTPAATPDILKTSITAKPIIGPMITRPKEVIKASLKENIFICVRATPKDISIITIIP